MNPRFACLALVPALALLFAPASHAASFHDDFSGTGFGDPRSQSGSLASLGYVADYHNGGYGFHTEEPQTMSLFGDVAISPDHLFNHQPYLDNGLSVHTQAESLPDSSLTLALFRSTFEVNGHIAQSSTTGFAVNVNPDDQTWTTYLNGQQQDQGHADVDGLFDLQVHVDNISDFAPDASADLRVLLNGQSIYQTSLHNQNLANNWLSLQNQGDESILHNLSINPAPVPAPLGLGIVGLGIVGLTRLRRTTAA